MSQSDWNPDLYLKFNKERVQPSLDLVSRLEKQNPESIIDVGCGPGNSTQILKQRWPESSLLGVDNSPSMIKKAGTDFPRQSWSLVDAVKDDLPGLYDLIFSNAAIQWMPNHRELFIKFRNHLTETGVLAIQIPLFLDMPLGKSLAAIGGKKPTEKFVIHSPSEYYDLLSDLFSSLDIWVTDYYHIMESQSAILEMMRSTGLRPYLERLETEAQKKDFERKVFESIQRDYPAQADGKVLFPFKRLFLIGHV